MKKINYTTAYDTTNAVCGYVQAEEHDNYYTITRGQYNRALKNRTIGGIAGIVFDADKPVHVVDEYGHVLLCYNDYKEGVIK